MGRFYWLRNQMETQTSEPADSEELTDRVEDSEPSEEETDKISLPRYGLQHVNALFITSLPFSSYTTYEVDRQTGKITYGNYTNER